MLKQSLFVLLGSLIIILFASEIGYVLNLVDHAHLMLTGMLAKVFAGGTLGSIIRHTISLFLIPFIVALIPTLIYWGVKRGPFKYYPHILWVSWLILATLIVVR